jgi:vitamin B12 transporter
VGGQYFEHANVLSSRALGVESALGLTVPGEFVSVDGNVTWQDLRSTSGSGPFGRYEGDRVPNRPYLLANGAITLRARNLATQGDVLELFWDTRYVHEFRRGWESNGPDEDALMVAGQLTHALALGHALTGEPLSVRSTVEVQNLTDERVYDFYGAQRPGRSVFFKMTLSL